MKIGQVTVSYKPIVGGQEVYIDSLSKVFREAGNQVHIYQPDSGVKEDDLFLSPSPNNPKGLEKIVPRLMRYNMSLLTHQFRNLRKEDLLIVHYPEHYPAVFWHKRALVLTHGVNWDFDPPRKRSIKEFLAKVSFQRAWRFVANDTNFLRAVGVEIKPGEMMFEEILPGRWFIPNCVDTEFFVKTNGIEEIKQLNAIVVPRNLSEARGLHLAVEAFEILAESNPNLHLLIVGAAIPVPDSVKYGENLLKKIEESPVKARIVFLGSKPWEEMRDIYSSAILTLIPTEGNEGTSLAALESMSVGTATITTNVAGLKDLPSFQVEPEAEKIAEAIKDVLKKRELIARDQNAKVREHFNLQNWKESWLRVVKPS